MDIRVLTALDAPAFFSLRLEALEREPPAFGESPEELRAASLDEIVRRLVAVDSFVLGAFDGSNLVGCAGFNRNREKKRRHKGLVRGVYVTDRCRGKGIGAQLLRALIDLARAQPGLEQINLTVSVQQTAAKRLYSSLGFETYGREAHALKVSGVGYVDEDLMTLHFSSGTS